jgi:hypothetical protein
VLVGGSAITDYIVGKNGMLFRGSAGLYPRPAWPAGRQNVSVTYDHGWSSTDLPRSLKVVALSIASRLIVQGVALEETIGANRVRYGVNATDLTSGEQRILTKYRRR